MIEVILTRLRIGHTRVTHSFLMENGNMPYCQDCLVPLSVLHILAECLTYDDESRRFFPSTVNISTSDRMVPLLAEPRGGMFDIGSLKAFLSACNLTPEI